MQVQAVKLLPAEVVGALSQIFHVVPDTHEATGQPSARRRQA